MLRELELNDIITVCAWCRTQINDRGIRMNKVFEKSEMEGLSNGICMVCAVENFK